MYNSVFVPTSNGTFFGSVVLVTVSQLELEKVVNFRQTIISLYVLLKKIGKIVPSTGKIQLTSSVISILMLPI